MTADPHENLAKRADAVRMQLEEAEASGRKADADVLRFTLRSIDDEARALNDIKQNRIIGSFG